MKIGIICASDTELSPFLEMIEGDRTSEKAMLTFHEGKIDGIEAAAVYSGVCKVNAAAAAQILIDSYNCGAVINSGCAGGMDESLGIYDTVVSTESAYHDVADDILTEFHPWMESVYFKSDEKLLAAAGLAAKELKNEYKTVFGRMVTGEQFIKDEKRDEINSAYSPLCVDMETAAIAHVCYVNRIPFISVRCITDTPKHRGTEHFHANCGKASQIAAELVRGILSKY